MSFSDIVIGISPPIPLKYFHKIISGRSVDRSVFLSDDPQGDILKIFTQILFFSPFHPLYFTESFQTNFITLFYRKELHVFHYRSPDRIIYDEEYTDRLIRENYADIYAYCFRHLGHRETAEDLTQETFLRFLRNVERYREYGKIKNYLYVVAGNVIRDHYRKQKEIPVEQELRAERDPKPDMAVEHAAERVGVREALAALESSDREIVILRYYQELKIRDIAAVMRMPASTVRYRLKAAEKELRRRLEKGGGTEWTEN